MIPFETIRCDHDGVLLEGLVTGPDTPGKYPAVMIMHSANGLRTKVRQSASLLAELGYVSVVTDMYGPDIQRTDANGVDSPMIKAFLNLGAHPERLRSRVVAWFDKIAAMPNVDPDRIAAIGYCFGGQCVLELARSGADVKAVVSYHGLLTTHAPAQPGTVKGEVAAYCGAKDPYAPLADIEGLRQELDAAGASQQIMVFGDAEHSFTDPEPATETRLPGISYNAIADKVSWAGTLALLETVLRN